MIGRTNTGGGGGGGLNFRVIGGTTAPKNPKENDIWVNGQKVEGFIFSAEKMPPNIYETELTCVDKLSGQYIGADGNISSNQNFAVTDYVELPKTTKSITVEHSITASSVMYHAFYDENKNFISSVFRENRTMVYDVPANAKYARMSFVIIEYREDNRKIIATVDDGTIAEGTVLVNVGNFSQIAFNALKKNNITVYPISAKQYVSGAWVEVAAKSYQGGEWVDWITYLYTPGNEWEDTTGGWVALAKTVSTGGAASAPTVAKTDKCMTVVETMYNNGGTSGIFVTSNAVDLTNYSELCFDISGTGGWTDVHFGVIESYDSSPVTFAAVIDLGGMQTGIDIQRGVYTLNVSSLKGNHHICLGMYNGATDNPVVMNIYNVFLK